MKLVIVKSLFCPDKDYLNKNFDSLIKLDAYFKILNNPTIEIDLYLIGWSYLYSKEIETFLKLIKLCFRNVIKIFWPVNYGKYKIFNSIQDHLKSKTYDYLFYLDHDIFLEFKNFDTFVSLPTLFDQIIENNKIGLVVYNQSEDCRHQKDIFENKLNCNNIDICWSNSKGSIACGSFLVKTSVFLELEPFNLDSVYGFDDMILIQKLADKNYASIVLEKIYVVHPYFKNQLYDKWKYDTIVCLINGKKFDYYAMIEESMNMWKNQQN